MTAAATTLQRTPLYERHRALGAKMVPPEFAKMIRDHERYINPKPDTIPWEEMARRSEQVMKKLFAEVQRSGYAQALDELADMAKGGTAQ